MSREALLDQLKALPERPGIYQYYDKNQRLLYVGKAKNLKKRVSSYFTRTLAPNPRNSPRIQRLIAQTHSLRSLVVENEKDALILENSLIKSQNPRYNILLRDDKTYPYICVNLLDPYPRFVITRRIEDKKGLVYFGPYPRGAKELIQILYDLFPLCQQASCLRGKKACLYYQLDRCLAPCEFDSKSLREDYGRFIQAGLSLLRDKRSLQRKLEGCMLDFASKELFEEALTCKHCLDLLGQLAPFSALDLKKLYNCDVLSFVMKEGSGVLLKLFVREGKVASTHSVFVRGGELGATEDSQELGVYKQALLKLASEPSLAKEILIANLSPKNQAALSLIASSLKPALPPLVLPKRGAKLELARLATLNASHLLENHQRLGLGEIKLLEAIKELLGLERIPNSIEVFDTSHHGGSFCVGGLVGYESGDFCKERYRHYNLKSPDEYGQMRELLMRRALSFDSLSAPDLWVLDGGRAQLKLAVEILESSQASVEVIAISKEKKGARVSRAKGAAKDILHTRCGEFGLDSRDERLQFFQKLRDEAHRFAISFHRHKKSRL